MHIQKRLVIQFTGYEGLHAKAIRGRHIQAVNDFDKLWQTKSKVSSMTSMSDFTSHMQVNTKADTWETETEFCQFGSEAIYDHYAQRNTLTRIATGFRAFADIVLTGTLYRYARNSWRFVLFFMWPFLLSLALIAITGLIACAPLIAGFSYLHLLWSLPLSLFIASVLIRTPGEKVFFSYLLDDWSAAYDRIKDKSELLRQQRTDFASTLALKLKETNAQEVVIFAHSLGSVQAIEALADVWRTNPELLRKQPVSLLLTGSCLLMIALHPSAKKLREDVRLILQDSPVSWIEIQVLTDIIHFYGSDPAKALKITSDKKPMIHRMRFKHMHSEKRYQRAKGNFFRMHLLYLKGAQIKNFYDPAMMLHGPFSLQYLTQEYWGQPAPVDLIKATEA
ncbi:alpha/beta hydrolase [Brucellaceae bacterium C25G]